MSCYGISIRRKTALGRFAKIFRNVIMTGLEVKQRATRATYAPMLGDDSPRPPLFSVFSVLRFANAVQKLNTEDTEKKRRATEKY
jgi:hypothetical protein